MRHQRTRLDYAPQWRPSHTYRVPAWLVGTAAAVCCAAAIWVGAVAADLQQRCRQAMPAVCDTDTSCAQWCARQGLQCDGGPEPARGPVRVAGGAL